MEVSAATGELYEMRNGLNGQDYSTWISELKNLWRWVGCKDLEIEINKALLMIRNLGSNHGEPKL